MGDRHAPCDRMDTARERITQDIGLVAIIDTTGLLFAISSDHIRFGWVKREVSLDELENVRVDEVFHTDVADVIQQGIGFCGNEKPPKSTTYVCDIFFSHRTYVSLLCQSDGKLVVEIENFPRAKVAAITGIVDTSNIIGKLVSNASRLGAVNDLCAAIFEASVYDRCMTYKFLDDFCGEVVFEKKNDHVVKSSFLGLRFPASDIPLSARRAYVKNTVRFIADVDKPSCRLILRDDVLSLGHSFLRGCSAPHKCYLQSIITVNLKKTG